MSGTSTGCTHELRFLPCSPGCANWLRYGIQPDHAGPGLRPGWCGSKAHDRENLGLGGRRVLVSRQWSGKTLTEHRADRATVVREALAEAGIVAPEIERLAADVTLPPTGSRGSCGPTPNPTRSIYARVILASIAERQRWRAQYEAAKAAAAACGQSFGNRTGHRDPTDRVHATDHTSASPITSRSLGRRSGGQG